MLAKDCVPLVEVTRGEIVESIHFGAFYCGGFTRDCPSLRG